MYKNFKLTEEERKQIMEMHQSHGYKKPINEVEKHVPSIDSPEDEEELSAEYGLDEPYDPYKEDPFKSIDSDDFYDEKIGALKAKGNPKRMQYDTSVNYTGPKPEGEKAPKVGPIKEYEINLKIDMYSDRINANLKKERELKRRLQKYDVPGKGGHLVRYYNSELADVRRRIQKNEDAIEKLEMLKNKLYPREN